MHEYHRIELFLQLKNFAGQDVCGNIGGHSGIVEPCP